MDQLYRCTESEDWGLEFEVRAPGCGVWGVGCGIWGWRGGGWGFGVGG